MSRKKKQPIIKQSPSPNRRGRQISWLSLIGIGETPLLDNKLGIFEYSGGIIVFLVALFTYLFTLTPDIGFHDCGDMVPAVVNLGVCHPPGYPFFCLLGKLFISLIPIGNIAYRMNFLSSIFASTTVMMVYFMVIMVGGFCVPKQRLLHIIPAVIGSFSLSSGRERRGGN
ncbi:DUF2723 domain-containing protein [Candidatus Desantisbacteria bacterium]|nr:DUF2723 domain-containing protein [Candidatus Desantisbacteria bacterium]